MVTSESKYKPQRYQLTRIYDAQLGQEELEMRADINGSWVRYEDIVALLKDSTIKKNLV